MIKLIRGPTDLDFG